MRHRLIPLFVLLLIGCDDASEHGRLSTEPMRTAVQDQALRQLALRIAHQRACDALRGRFIPVRQRADLSDTDASQPAAIVGRVHVVRCGAQQRESHLRLELEGSGWSWVDEVNSGPLASRFRARGMLRFTTTIEVEGALDFNVENELNRVTASFTPSQAPGVSFRSTNTIPITAQGGWSRLLGNVGEVLGGSSLEHAASPMIHARGRRMISAQVAPGFSLSVDLCDGQMSLIDGPVARHEALPSEVWPSPEAVWSSNLEVHLRPGHLDMDGPWPASSAFRMDLKLNEGDALRGYVVCEQHAREWLPIAGRRRNSPGERPHLGEIRLNQGEEDSITVDASSCRGGVLLVTHNPGSQRAHFFLRSVDAGSEAEALVDCGVESRSEDLPAPN